MTALPTWTGQIDRWYAEGRPFVGVIGFDPSQGWVVPEEHAADHGLYFAFGAVNGLADRPSERAVEIAFEKPSPAAYAAAFKTVHDALLRGETYLTNLCTRARVYSRSTLHDMFDQVHAKYKVLWKGRLLCFSPETFVSIEDGLIRTYPMKGTIDASTPDAGSVLLSDVKEVAEHHTIIDLMRNDLSMISDEVRVLRRMYLDRIETQRGPILQMSSEIQGQLRPEATSAMGRALYRLLPAGSISGAPKIRTLEVISDAEWADRGYYTGIFVHFDGRRLVSAVMIRYIAQDERGHYWYHSGGGITARSEWEKEYNETVQKIYLPVH